jgi:hypothetical protein
VIAMVVAGLMSYLVASPISPGGADPGRDGPPLSSIALMSGFAREQNFAVGSIGQQPEIPADAGVSTGERRITALVGSEKRLNQDFSLTPQNETTIAVNPFSPNMIVAGAHDYRLGNPIGAAFYTTFDSGFTWRGFPPLCLG